MLRARRQTPKAQACQLFANSSLMHGDAEALFDLAFQINAPARLFELPVAGIKEQTASAPNPPVALRHRATRLRRSSGLGH